MPDIKKQLRQEARHWTKRAKSVAPAGELLVFNGMQKELFKFNIYEISRAMIGESYA